LAHSPQNVFFLRYDRQAYPSRVAEIFYHFSESWERFLFMSLKKLFFLSLCLLPLAALALSVKPGTPAEYVVQKGDTLSTIAQKFLTNPSQWRDILAANPQIKNPNRIFPGQVIRFDGAAATRASAASAEVAPAGGRNVRLAPSVRSAPLFAEAASVSVDAIQQFLFRPQVVSAEVLATAAEVAGNAEGRLLSGSNSTVYVKGDLPADAERFVVVRPRGQLQDPNDRKVILAQRTEFLGEATLVKRGAVSELRLDNMVKEVLVGDKILPFNREFAFREFYPVPPADNLLEGQIVDLVDALTRVAQYQIAVINLGAEQGVLEGTVFAVYRAPQLLASRGRPREKIVAPDIFAGNIMVFAVFPRVSFALVTHSRSPIHLGDRIRSPEAR
jgi:LysM repeat protein